MRKREKERERYKWRGMGERKKDEGCIVEGEREGKKDKGTERKRKIQKEGGQCWKEREREEKSSINITKSV